MGDLSDIKKDSSIQQRLAGLGLTETEEVEKKEKRGITRLRWTTEMDDFLLDMYTKVDTDKCLSLIRNKFNVNITKGAMYSRANHLGLSRHLFWTDEMTDYLVKYYNKQTLTDFVKGFNGIFGTNITNSVAASKATSLEVTKCVWTDEMDTYLRESYGHMKTGEIAKNLNARFGTAFCRYRVSNRARILKLSKNPPATAPVEDVKVVKESIPVETVNKVSEKKHSLDFPVRKKKKNVFLRIYDAIFNA